MNDADANWRRLLRKADLPESQAGAYDSAWITRVAARAMEERETPEWQLSMAWRALGLAAVVTVVTLGVNLRSWNQVVEAEAAAIETLPTSVETLDLS